MENTSILKVLTQLESDLNDIKSAKEQVENVLTADNEINGNLATYGKQLASIVNQLGSLNDVIKSELGNISDNVETDINRRLKNISDLITKVEILSSDVEEKVKKSCTDISDDFRNSCDAITKSFEEKSNGAIFSLKNQTSESTKKLAEDTIEIINKFEKGTSENIEKLMTSAKEVKKTCTGISDDFRISCDTITKLFEEKSNGAIFSLKNQTSESTKKLAEDTIEIINKFESSTSKNIETLIVSAKDLSLSSLQFSGAKDELLSKLIDVFVIVTEYKTSIKKIEDSISSMVKVNSTINQNISISNQKIDKCLSSIDMNRQSLQDSLSMIANEFKEINSISTEHGKIINRNQNFIFGTMVLIVIDIILHFIF